MTPARANKRHHTSLLTCVCPCALLCGTTHARQNIGLADGGVIKNENKRGLRDTTVHVSDFGPHLGLPGMIDPANPVQFGHYPAVGDTTVRYDAGGPCLGKDDGTRRFNFEVPADALPGKRLQFQYRNTRVEYIVKRDDHPGDKIQVDILKPGHEWWRGMRKGKAQLLWETGWVNPTISANIGAEWINDWPNGYKPTEQELNTKKRTSDGKKNATLFLDQRKDFAGEQTVVEKLFCRYGHLVIASPRYHPELAGLGIEYCWGKAKWCFRRYVNDLVSTNLEKNVLIALGSRAYPMFGTGAGCPAPPCRTRAEVRPPRAHLSHDVCGIPHAGERGKGAGGVEKQQAVCHPQGRARDGRRPRRRQVPGQLLRHDQQDVQHSQDALQHD